MSEGGSSTSYGHLSDIEMPYEVGFWLGYDFILSFLCTWYPKIKINQMKFFV